jgi:curved DNA-binding protein CbpA
MAAARNGNARDLYELLGVSRGADGETLRDAYDAKVRELDSRASNEPEAQARLREVSLAYDLLSKPRSRMLYDRLAYRGRAVDRLERVADVSGTEDEHDLVPPDEAELVEWPIVHEPAALASHHARADRLTQLMAAVGLVIAIVLFAILLMR